MSDEELNDLERTELYRRSPVLNHARHSLTKISPTEKSVVMELHKIPKRHIGKYCMCFITPAFLFCLKIVRK